MHMYTFVILTVSAVATYSVSGPLTRCVVGFKWTDPTTIQSSEAVRRACVLVAAKRLKRNHIIRLLVRFTKNVLKLISIFMQFVFSYCASPTHVNFFQTLTR